MLGVALGDHAVGHAAKDRYCFTKNGSLDERESGEASGPIRREVSEGPFVPGSAVRCL